MDAPNPSVAVLGLNYAPEHTGIAPYTTAMARHLAAQGMPTTAVVGYPHYPAWEVTEGFRERRRDRQDGGVHLVRMRHPVPSGGGGLPRIAMEAVFAAQVGRRLFRYRPDVLVAVSPALLTVVPALVSARLRGRAVGVVVQDLYGAALAETGMGGGVLVKATAWLERRLLRAVDGVVVIHEVFRRRLVESGVAAERIEVVANWAHVEMPDVVDRGAVRARLGWGADEVIALHAGNMGVKQGLDGLVDVARLAESRGSRVRVVLLGDGSQRERIEELGAEVGALTVTPPLPAGEFEAALMAADVLVLHEKPGVVEMSVPSKLTSYFTAGRPVVAATDPRSGAASLMEASQAGVVAPAGDAAAILDAIEQAGSDPAQAELVGGRGRAFARDHLSAQASLGRYEGWVRALARRGRRAGQ